MKGVDSKKIDLLTVFFLTVIGFTVYSNTLDASFLLDDLVNIVDNQSIRMEEFSLRGLIEVRSFYSEYIFDRPLAYMTFALNYYYGGLNVFGYHLVNTIIHILTGIGVYHLVKVTAELSGANRKSNLIAAWTALLWLVSPVQTQAVTYIVQRMTSMAAMFYVYSLLFYVKGRTGEGRKAATFLSLSTFFFLLALLSKQNTITLPLFIVLYEYCFLRTAQVRAGSSLYLTLAIGVLLVAGLLYLSRDYLEIKKFLPTGYAFRERVMTEARVIMFYISIMFLPVASKLAFYHDFPFSRGLLSPFSTLPSIIFIAAAIVFSLIRLRRDPFVSFFVLWFFINILPESLFLQIYPVFEHRLYLPSVGFYAAIVCLVARVFESMGEKGRGLSLAVLLLIPALFSINTYERNKDWHDDLSIWSDNVRKSPDIPNPHEGLGMAYMMRGELEQAEAELKAAKGLDPLSSSAGLGLGILYYKKGDISRAFEEFEYIARRKDIGVGLTYLDTDRAFYKIGEELLQAGKIQDAIKIFRLGLHLNPENAEMRQAMAKIEGGFEKGYNEK